MPYYNHCRQHGWFAAPTPRSAAALRAAAEARDYALECRRQGRLLSPYEALALAGHGARECETLYSIALRLAQEHNVEVTEILADLSRRFPAFA